MMSFFSKFFLSHINEKKRYHVNAYNSIIVFRKSRIVCNKNIFWIMPICLSVYLYTCLSERTYSIGNIYLGLKLAEGICGLCQAK